MAEPQGFSTTGPPEVFQPPKKPPRNKYALGCATLASMTSVLLGYDIGVMSGASIFIKEDLHVNDTEIEILLGIINIYSLVGSLLAGRTSDWIGRRYTIVFAAVLFFVGAILMGFATNYAFLMVGRFVAGVGIGYAIMIAPCYTTEVAPASARGFLTSFPEVFINIGILLGYVANLAFAGLSLNLGWRFMLGVGALPSIFLGFGVLTMPESPRWLVMQGRLGDARRVLEKTSDCSEEVLLRLADIKEAAKIPPECNDDIVVVPKQKHGEGVWKEIVLPTPAVRRILLVAIGIHFFQQASGIDAVVLYSPRIFEKAGIHDKNKKLGATIAVGFVKTVFILVGTFMVDRVGRRVLVLCSLGGMVISVVFLGFGLTMVDTHPNEKLMWAIVICIVMVLAYVAFFSIGMGPVTWVYCAEILPLRLRATGSSLAAVVNRVTSGVISMTFLSLSKAITIGGSFFLFGGIGFVAWVFFFTFMPETQGRNLEDMNAVFHNFRWRESFHKNGNDRSERTTSKGEVQLG